MYRDENPSRADGGKLVRFVRRRAKMTQRDLAFDVGVSDQYIRHIERGATYWAGGKKPFRATTSVLAGIADRLKLSEEELTTLLLAFGHDPELPRQRQGGKERGMAPTTTAPSREDRYRILRETYPDIPDDDQAAAIDEIIRAVLPHMEGKG